MQNRRLTTKQIIYGAKFLFSLMADKYSGNCTIHQLMILNAFFVCADKGVHCTLNRIVELTGIPNTTVRRAITRLKERGHLVAQPDPDDKRRMLYFIGERISRSPNDIELIKNAFQARY